MSTLKTTAFSSPGRFWRGNLHTHSTRSDGHWSPEQVCAFYRESGYDFLALTDHFLECYDFPITDTRSFRTSDFTTILGAELHTGQTLLGELWHILAVGLPLNFPRYLPHENGPQAAARALAAGAFVAVAHPSWYGLTEEDIQSLGAIHAVEVYNGTASDLNDKPDSWPLLDVLLMRGAHLNACATDDAHFNPERADTIRGWVYVKSKALHPDSLLEGLKTGAFYSSTGPQIHDIQIHAGNRLSIACSPAERIWIIGYGPKAASAYGNGITTAEFDLRDLGDSPYVRVAIRDRQGGRAWSNPLWL